MNSLREQRVVITGASEGIGRALAVVLAARGARLALAARDPGRLESAAADCRSAGAEVLAVPTDVAERAACERLVAAAIARFGGIDVLVNNAGITMWSRFEDVREPAIFERLMAVNYLGAVHMTAAALPALRASRGLIVAVASLAGLTGVPERSGYAASKHAMIGFFESLRIELAGSGVDVTIVAPDFVVSQIHRRALDADGRALGASPMLESKIMAADECARRIAQAIEHRPRLLIMSARGRFGRYLKLVAPAWLDRIAARAIRKRH